MKRKSQERALMPIPPTSPILRRQPLFSSILLYINSFSRAPFILVRRQHFLLRERSSWSTKHFIYVGFSRKTFRGGYDKLDVIYWRGEAESQPNVKFSVYECRLEFGFWKTFFHYCMEELIWFSNPNSTLLLVKHLNLFISFIGSLIRLSVYVPSYTFLIHETQEKYIL